MTEPAATQGTTTHARVLHLINGEHYAGAERVQDLLGLRLPELGFDVGFACIKPGKFPDVRRAQAAPLFRCPMRGRFDLRPACAVARLVRREGYDLLHTHTPRTALVGRVAAALSGVPMIHHLHSPTSADTTHRLRNWLNVATERLSLGRIQALITVSHSLGRYALESGYDESKVFVVHNGVPACGPLAPRCCPSGVWTIGMVALFRPRKGLEVLIDALALLRREGRQVRLRAVGPFETPDYEHAIRQHAARAGVDELVDWRGFQKDIAAELATFDLFVLPSLFGEGLPMVVLEAMAAGVPVIGTDVEGVPEAVRDGVDGLIAAPGNPASLASAIGRFAAGEVDWSRMRVSAHRRHAEGFSDHSMAAGVAAVYRRAMGIVAGPGAGADENNRLVLTR